ncbi:MAG: Ribonuclease P protein component 3 [Methanosaeta sp. PtaU1.Bin060]|jgi:ribonuclease P/MRP protein subunit RPP1|nr:MAG: Ribonuclease P protein component 3 [Methanosaeta sp. PtaU1.Bin060]
MSFYECLKSFPEGSDSPSRLALVAKRLGWQGIIICNEDPRRIFRIDAAEKVKDISISVGAEVTAPNARALRSRVFSLRARYPFITVRGETEELIRAACEDANVDLLLLGQAWRPLGIAQARAAEQNQIAIGFDLSPLIRLRGSSRSRWMEVAKRNLELARKFDLSMAITSRARSHLDMRSPRALVALAEVVGFEHSEAEEALKLPARLVALNRRNWIGPGVELL